jgi:hypothetical protein
MVLRCESAGFSQVIRRLLHNLSMGNPQKLNVFSTSSAQDLRSKSRPDFPQDLRMDSEGNSRLV